MAEKATSATSKLFSDLSASWMNTDGIKKVAEWYIDTNEKIAMRTLDYYEQATEWAKDTAIAPIIEAQKSLAHQVIEGSTQMARSLWRIGQDT
jgi:hypothetical protein